MLSLAAARNEMLLVGIVLLPVLAVILTTGDGAPTRRQAVRAGGLVGGAYSGVGLVLTELQYFAFGWRASLLNSAGLSLADTTPWSTAVAVVAALTFYAALACASMGVGWLAFWVASSSRKSSPRAHS